MSNRSAVAQHARRRTESFASRRSVLDTSCLPHGMLVGFDPAGGRRGDHALLDLRAGGCAGCIVKSASMRLTFGDPATGFGFPPTGFRLALGGASASFGFPATGLGFTLGGTSTSFSFPATGFGLALGSAAPCFRFAATIFRCRPAVGSAGAPAFGTPPATAGTGG